MRFYSMITVRYLGPTPDNTHTPSFAWRDNSLGTHLSLVPPPVIL